MKNIDNTYTVDALKALKKGDYIVLEIDKNTSSELEELTYKKSSIEELFKSSLDSSAPVERIFEVIKQYTAINILLEKTKLALLKQVLDEKAFIYLKDPTSDVQYYINFTFSAVVISKKLT